MLKFNKCIDYILEHGQVPVQQKPIGLIGYATEDGIVFIKAFDEHSDHSLLLNNKRPLFGINPERVRVNIKRNIDSDRGMSTADIAGWRYSYKSQTLFFWSKEVTDPLLREYVQNFITDKLHLTISKIRGINYSDASFRQSHHFESKETFTH